MHSLVQRQQHTRELHQSHVPQDTVEQQVLQLLHARTLEVGQVFRDVQLKVVRIL